MSTNPRIELVIPPNPYLGDDKRNPPLGLMYLAAVAEQKGYHPTITDLRGKKPEEFLQHLGNSDVYGITASTPDYRMALHIARIAKQKSPKAWTVIGGIHATSLPEEISPIFDKVVIGEGENAFIDLLADHSAGRDSTRFYTGLPIPNIDVIPFPARHLIPFDSVFSKNAFKVDGDYAGTIMTSRGCANKCSFCASDKMWQRRVRFRSPDNVVEELKQVIDTYGVRNFRFQDDTMTLRRDRLEELCSKMAPLGIKWRATTRVDQADEARLRMMKEAGCEELGYGVESLSQSVLDQHAKMINIDQVYLALENTAKAGLRSRLFLIIGLPGEPPGYSQRLDDFLRRANPDGVDLSTLVPYPGSDIYHNPTKYGIKLKPNGFEIYHMTLGLAEGEVDRPLTFVHDKLSEAEIMAERKKSLELIRKRKMVKNF